MTRSRGSAGTTPSAVGAGNDSLSGGGGDDSLSGGEDTDSADGGEGTDTCDGSPRPSSRARSSALARSPSAQQLWKVTGSTTMAVIGSTLRALAPPRAECALGGSTFLSSPGCVRAGHRCSSPAQTEASTSPGRVSWPDCRDSRRAAWRWAVARRTNCRMSPEPRIGAPERAAASKGATGQMTLTRRQERAIAGTLRLKHPEKGHRSEEATMSSDAPGAWDVAQELIGNLRELRRRAELDALRFALIAVGFLMLRSQGAEITAVGLTVPDPQIVQFFLIPYGALLWLRSWKAHALTDTVEGKLKGHLASHDMDVPREALPMDWDMLRDGAQRFGMPSNAAGGFGPLALGVGVALGLGVSLFDAGESGDYVWFLVAAAATVAITVIGLLGKSAWDRSFF